MYTGNGAVRDRGRISWYVGDLVSTVCLMKFCYIETYGRVNFILKSFGVIKGKESEGKDLNIRPRSQAGIGHMVSKT